MFRKFLSSLVFPLLIFSYPLNAEVVQVDNETLKRLIAEGITLIDVRSISEWRETGIIEGSYLLTFFDESGRYDVNAWLKKLQDIVSPDKPVAFICAIGGRTQAITHFLDNQAGYEKVHNVTAGIKAWIDAGNATVPLPPQAIPEK
jgi:rhodanese-related sulfurtransferase